MKKKKKSLKLEDFLMVGKQTVASVRPSTSSGDEEVAPPVRGTSTRSTNRNHCTACTARIPYPQLTIVTRVEEWAQNCCRRRYVHPRDNDRPLLLSKIPHPSSADDHRKFIMLRDMRLVETSTSHRIPAVVSSMCS
jgi:hypothetical protein